MPLPSSGAISISQIRTELGTSSGSLRTLSSIAGKSTPDAMSEFYGYSASVNVDITAYFPSFMGCYNTYTFSATSSIPVNTNLNVGINWYGDLGGFFTTSVSILNGNSCGNTVINSADSVNCIGEVRQNEFWSTFPTTSGNQVYIGGNYFYDDIVPDCSSINDVS
jgi:hypothetical protein